MPSKKSEAVPSAVAPAHAVIVALIDTICAQHLNKEYAELAHRLAATLARKRPSPIVRGKPEIWACAILYALGTVNFLFDKKQKPHLRSDELCALCGVSTSTGANKAKLIRDLLKIGPMDPNWCLPHLVDKNPLVWMLKVNGFFVDVRHMPREVQELAYAKGLIPYIPADKE